MSKCCVQHTDEFFDMKNAQKDLKRYHKKGPLSTTRILLDELQRLEIARLSLLEIGGGIGIIVHELVPLGIGEIVSVEMSSASLDVARSEAQKLGYVDRLTLIHGDLVEEHAGVPESDIVVLDRVICCYPQAGELLEKAMAKSRKLLAVSYPKESWFSRLGFQLENWQLRLTGHDFRIYIHPENSIRDRIRQGGFTPLMEKRTLMWNIEIYQRAGAR